MTKLTFVILLYILKMCEAEDYNCLNCEDFNRQNLIECPVHLTDCGECEPGNIPDELDSRICFALEILTTPPKSVGGVEGQLIELPCEFNSKVECAWERNNQYVNIDNSTRYMFKTKGVTATTPAMDCSLIIEDLNHIDIGEWQCGSRATSSTLSVKSDITSVFFKEVTTKAESKEFQVSEISVIERKNTIHVYLDGKIVDGSVISMIKITNGSRLECRTEVEVDELRWEIDGQSIVKVDNKSSVQMNSKDIERYYQDDRSYSKVYCVAHHIQQKEMSSYIFITNQRSVETTAKVTEQKSPLAAVITAAILLSCAILVSWILFIIWYLKNRRKIRRKILKYNLKDVRYSSGNPQLKTTFA